MRLAIFAVSIVILALAEPLHAASGGGGGGAVPQQPIKRLTPQEKALVAYNAGLKHRDRAAKYERKAAEESNEKKLAKLQKKITKEYNRAIDDYEKAIGHYHRFFQAHGSLGYALRKVGRFEESIAAYDESLRINPGYGEAIEYRGEAYLRLNRLEDAKEAYMTLFQSDRALADQLMAAMIDWVAARRDNAEGLDPELVEQFAKWVDQRASLASYVHPTDAASRVRWAE